MCVLIGLVFIHEEVVQCAPASDVFVTGGTESLRSHKLAVVPLKACFISFSKVQ